MAMALAGAHELFAGRRILTICATISSACSRIYSCRDWLVVTRPARFISDAVTHRLNAAIASVVADRGNRSGYPGLVRGASAVIVFQTIALPVPVRKIVLLLGAVSFAGWLSAPILARGVRFLPLN